MYIHYMYMRPVRAALGCVVSSWVAHEGWNQRGSSSVCCRGTSLLRKIPLLGPYSRTAPRVLWWS